MAIAKKAATLKPQTHDEIIEAVTPAPGRGLLNIGDIVSIVSGGRTLPNYEVLDMDDKFIKFRASIHIAPQTEIVLIPWAQLEAVGLVGQR